MKTETLQVFVVWEPVLLTDRLGPTSDALSRISDPRVSQFWDVGLVVSEKVHETVQSNRKHVMANACPDGEVVWDIVALFSRGTQWGNSFPEPTFAAGPVVKVISELHERLTDVSNGNILLGQNDNSLLGKSPALPEARVWTFFSRIQPNQWALPRSFGRNKRFVAEGGGKKRLFQSISGFDW